MPWGRGGGSAEDLWAFNERVVAEAIFASQTPIISAVGHEVDQSISNLVADLAVSTPTAAAEAATFSYEDFLRNLENVRDSLDRQMDHAPRCANSDLSHYESVFSTKSPKAKLLLYRRQYESLMDEINRTMTERIAQNRQTLNLTAARLHELSPAKRMSNGFAFVTKEDGSRLKSVTDTKTRESITLYLSDGSISAEVKEIRGN